MLFSGLLVVRSIGRSYSRLRVAENALNFVGKLYRKLQAHAKPQPTTEECPFSSTSQPFHSALTPLSGGKKKRSRPNLMLTASPPGTHPITSEISQEHIARPTRAP